MIVCAMFVIAVIRIHCIREQPYCKYCAVCSETSASAQRQHTAEAKGAPPPGNAGDTAEAKR